MSAETFLDGKIVLRCGDSRDVLKTIPDCSIDSIVTDPPYALVSIVKRFGGKNAAPVKVPEGGSGAYARASSGFMGRTWDVGETVESIEFWAECLRVLKPGGHLAAFSGTRTQHRQTMAIDEAGFEIRDQLYWHYGSGFPKSHDVSKGIQKRRTEDEGPVRVVCRAIRAAMDALDLKSRHLVDHFDGCHPRLVDHWAARDTDSQPALPAWSQWLRLKEVLRIDDGLDAEVWRLNGRKGEPGDSWSSAEIIGEIDGVAPGLVGVRFDGDNTIRVASDEAGAWQGWGTALKPATEPICLARKPLERGLTVAANVLKWGTGALNIDGCRIGSDTRSRSTGEKISENLSMGGGNYSREIVGTVEGRWPANVLLDGSEAVIGSFPIVGDAHPPANVGSIRTNQIYGADNEPRTFHPGFSDEGSAARFFYQAPKDDRCDLCDVNIAPNHSPTKNILTVSIVPPDVADSQPLESAAIAHRSSDSANDAESHSLRCRQQSESSAQNRAATPDELKIDQNVRSAANLCDLCATDIARGLVELRRNQSAASLLFQGSISEHSAQILRRYLALYVAHREDTDIILTIPNLKILLGSVSHAIGSTTPLTTDTQSASPGKSHRFWYGSKADSDDRTGSRHPTVKPVALMQWLCRLVTPPGGTVLDPFAGTGTTGEAAFREGFKAVLIEREEEYQNDIRRRMALCMSGPEERKRESIKAKLGDVPFEAGSLFADLSPPADPNTPPRRPGRQIYGVFADERSGRSE